MKKYLLGFAAVSTLICGAALYLPSVEEKAKSEPNENAEAEADNPEAEAQREFMMTHDPRTNTIPRERLYAALEYYGRLAHQAGASKGADIANYGTIGWTERGPSAIGGRTRALLFDANDPFHKKVFAGSVGGGLWVTTDITASPITWTPVNDQFANLAVTAVAQDPTTPNTLYFGTGEGFGNVDAIKGGGIWKSTDDGATWANLPTTANSDNFNYVQKIVVTASHTIIAATRSYYCNDAGGILRSANGGTSFTEVIGTPGTACPNSGAGSAVDINGSDLEVAANGDIYASVGNNVAAGGKVFKSTSASDGVAWSNITPGASAGLYRRIELAVAPSNSSRVYATCQGTSSNNVTAIYTSNNGGASWTACAVPTVYNQGTPSNYTNGQAFYNQICAVDPNNDQTVYIGGLDILKSTDAGTSWTQITTWSLYNALNGSEPTPFFAAAQNVHADQHAFVFAPGSSTTALSGNDGGIYYSTNLTTVPYPSWTNKDNSYNVTQYYSCATHPTSTTEYLTGAQDNGAQHFVAGSYATVSGGDGAFCWISKLNGAHQVSTYIYNNLYVTTNSWGSNYQPTSNTSASGQFINPGDLDNDNEILYTAGSSNTLCRWTNLFNGTASAVVRADLTVGIGGTVATAITVSPNTPTTVYIGTSAGNIYRITGANTGTTPTVTQIATNLGPAGSISSINVWKKVVGTADDSIVVALSNYGINSVYLTGNGSQATPSWTDIDDNSTLQDIPVRWAAFSPVNNSIVFLATEVGVFGSKKLTGTSTGWQQINNSVLPMVRTDMIQFNSSNQMAVATHGRGLWTSSDVSPLPIRLLAFGAKVNGNDAQLDWEMADGQEASGYTIERMYNGEQYFNPVISLSPSSGSHYTATDIAPDWSRGPLRYRLKFTEQSGTIYYSDIRQLAKSDGNEFIASVYPTTTSDVINIRVGAAAVNTLKIAVLAANGQVMMQSTVSYQNTSISLRQFSAGQYFVIIGDVEGKYRRVTRVQKQ